MANDEKLFSPYLALFKVWLLHGVEGVSSVAAYRTD